MTTKPASVPAHMRFLGAMLGSFAIAGMIATHNLTEEGPLNKFESAALSLSLLMATGNAVGSVAARHRRLETL